jgi:carboxyl-terminal processing protease
MRYKTAENFVQNYVPPASMLQDFAAYAQKQGVERNEVQLKRSGNYLLMQIKALIGRNLFDNDAYFPVILKEDKAFSAALRELEKK